MRLLHLSDLHIGKKVNEFSMLEEQKYILGQIVNLVYKYRPDYVILAGDIYDKPIPSVEAVEVFDEFLFQMAKCNQKTIIISGNHDSSERLGFAGRLFKDRHIFISTAFDKDSMLHTDKDEYGEVDFYMIPFIKPIMVRRYFEDSDWRDYTDMFETVLQYLQKKREQNQPIFDNRRKVLIAHQFITGALRSDSEEVSVGGLDNISAEILSEFDYVALGHIHAPQQIQNERIRYSGSIYKYSFSEEHHEKCALLVELGKPHRDQKCEIYIEKLPLVGKRDYRTVKGNYDVLTKRENYIHTAVDDYIRVILTDEEEQPDAFYKLRAIYPNLMSLEYSNSRTKSNEQITAQSVKNRSPLESFEELYRLQNNKELSAEQKFFVKKIFEDIFEEN